MNQRHPIDDLFSQQLSNASIKPAPDMWTRIAQERKRRQRKRWWAIGGLSSLALAFIAGLFLWANSQGATEQPIVSSPSLEVIDHTLKNNPSENKPLPSSPSTTELFEVQQNSVAAPSNKERNQQTAAQQDLIATSQTNTAISKTASVPASTPVAASSTNSTVLNTSDQVANIPNSATTNLDETEVGATVENTLLLTAQIDEQNTNLETSNKEEDPTIVGPHQRRLEYQVSQLPTFKFNLEEKLNERLFASQAPKCARFTGSFLKYDLEVLAGPAYAHQILATKSSEGSQHLNQRKNSESPRMSFSEGFRIAATTPSGIGFRTGVISTRINDRFKHYEGIMTDTIYNTIKDANDNIIAVDTTVSSREIYATATNHLDFIEIPLLLSYETQVGKLRLTFNAGAYLNIAFDAQGQVLSPADGEPVDFGQVGESNVLPVFRAKASAAWYGGVTVAYNLHSRYSIIAEPYVKSYPKDLANPSYGLRQNYLVTGLQLGLRMRL